MLEKYSRKRVIEEIKMEVECSEYLITALSKKISEWKMMYLSGNIGKMYDSKTQRVKKVTDTDEIAISLIFTTLMMKSNTIQSYIGHLASQLNLDMSEFDKVKTAAEIIGYCNNTIYNLIVPALGSFTTYKVEPKLNISDELTSKLTRTFFLPPSDEVLLDWTNKSNGGYSFERNYAILGDYFNKHDMPINLNVLNILQRVEYELIPEIVNEPEVPKEDMNDEAKEAFKLAQIQARKVYEEYMHKKFRFVYQYDKRGRIYSRGYDLNTQGNSYRKASLRFAKKEKLTDRGIYWLKVDLANNYGLDKILFEDRVNWVNANIDSMLANPQTWIDKADEPLLFKKALLAYQEGVIEGKPIGHICQLDATASGPQILSVLARDEIGMKYLNVLGNDERYDLYTLVAKEVYENTKNSPLWNKFNGDFSAIRKQIKKCIMTSYYNSQAKPKEFFGADTKELDEFYKALKKLTPGAIKAQNYINGCWDDKRDTNVWTLPDGHTAYCPVSKTLESRIEIPECSAKIVYTHTVHKANSAEHRSLAPNLVHSLDGMICRHIISTLDNEDIQVCPIHDSFGVHPNYCDRLRTAYRGMLARLYREPIFESLLSEITGKSIKLDLPAINPDIEKAIRNNTNGYYIC